jgi:hypothetical protein
VVSRRLPRACVLPVRAVHLHHPDPGRGRVVPGSTVGRARRLPAAPAAAAAAEIACPGTESCAGFSRLGKWPEPTLVSQLAAGLSKKVMVMNGQTPSTPRYRPEGLPAEPLPGLPPPRLTFTGQFPTGKASEVLVAALALAGAAGPPD